MEIERILKKYEYLMLIIINQLNVGNYDLREDIKQEMRMHVFSLYKRGIFDSNINNIDNYVFIALKRKAINVLKSEKRQQHASLNQKKDNLGTEYLNLLIYNEENCQNRELFENIIAYMSKNLNDEEQNLINLYFFMDMTFDEIGKSFNVSRETIRRRINKAIAKIRRWYK